MLKGIAASPGLAMATALVLEHRELNIDASTVKDSGTEITRLQNAVDKSTSALKAIRATAEEKLGNEHAMIFDAHLMILQDPEILSQTEQMIKGNMVNAPHAFQTVTDRYIQMFEGMDNVYMQERAADIRDVRTRVLNALMGIETIDLSMLSEDTILIAHDLTPSETATMDKNRVFGFATDIGGRTSHTAIMARTLEIPAVVGLNSATQRIKSGDLVLLNGSTGEITVCPDSEKIEAFKDAQNQYDQYKAMLKEYTGKPSVTLDGKHIELAGNIGSSSDLEGLHRNDAEGVGLFRTEFLYMNRSKFPTEDEQFEAYKQVLEGMNGKPVVIRTLDIGGDKELSYFDIGKEMNPFLGYRAIRICLRERAIFETQLRALLRASVYGKLRIMFPMISCLEELQSAKSILEEVKAQLDSEGIAYSNAIEVGMMIEIPAAAICSDILAEHVDFFSIGTNDLIQYTCAVDRMNEKISDLYNPYNPALIRLIKTVIDNGHQAGIWVGMCGELAGDPVLTPLLLGLGLDEFSMSPLSILPIRKLVSELTLERTREIAQQVLSLSRSADIHKCLKDL